MPKLTDRQRVFCHHVVQGMSATEAARKAGYSASYADREANRLVEKSQVAQYLAELRDEAKSDAVMTIEELQEWWSNLVHTGVMRTFMDGEEVRAIIDAKERMKASDLLGKSLGAFTERHEHRFPQKDIANMTLEEVEEELRARGVDVD